MNVENTSTPSFTCVLFFLKEIWYFKKLRSVVVKHLYCNDEDVGLNPTTTISLNRTLGGPLQKVAEGSEQDLSGRQAM